MLVNIPKDGDPEVRIDEHDTWNMCDTLAVIILPMLKQLRARKHGSPSTSDEDVPEHLKSTAAPPKENEWDADDLIHARWEWIMDEMIWAFEQIVDEDAEDRFYTGTADFITEPVEYDEKGEVKFYELKHGPNHTQVFDKEGYLAWAARIERGTTLFGKYYQGLWD